MISTLLIISFGCLFSADLVRPTRPPRTTTTPTTTVGPTTTTEVRSGMNLCDPDPFGPMKKNGYEINLVICEANEVCQPLASTGELAKIGYIFFFFFKFTRPNPPLGLAEIGRDVSSLGFHNSSRCEWR